MNFNFQFNPDDYEERDFTPLAPGDYRIRIDNVEPKQSKAGNPMFELTLAVSGKNQKLWHYIVLTSDTKRTNQTLGDFFKAFGITDYDLNHWAYWPGKTAGCRVKQETDKNTGEINSRVHYFLSKEKTDKLPPWEEPANGLMQGAPPEGMSQAVNVPPWDAQKPW